MHTATLPSHTPFSPCAPPPPSVCLRAPQVLLSARPSSPSTDGGHPHPLPSSSPTRSDHHDEPPSPRGGMDPMAVLYHISPASALSCIPVFLIVELRPLLHSQIAQVEHPRDKHRKWLSLYALCR